MPNTIDNSVNELYKKIENEVVEVAYNQQRVFDDEIEEKDIENIAHRICEDRIEDESEFWVELSYVEVLTNEDDWGDVNDCIANMIRKYLKEKKQVQQ